MNALQYFMISIHELVLLIFDLIYLNKTRYARIQTKANYICTKIRVYNNLVSPKSLLGESRQQSITTFVTELSSDSNLISYFILYKSLTKNQAIIKENINFLNSRLNIFILII